MRSGLSSFHTDYLIEKHMGKKLERTLFYLTLIAVSIIMGSAYFLPMIDLPQHAGQVETLREIITGVNAPWLSHVEMNYFTSYWIGYASTLVLSFVLPVNYAVNVVVAIAFLLFVLSFSSLRKEFNGPDVLDWLLLPSFFGFAYILGLLTYLLAIPIGVLLVKQNLKYLKNGSSKYLASTVLTGILLYFSHMLIFLFFCQISVFMTLVDKEHGFKEKLKKLFPFYVLVLLIPLFFLNPDYVTQENLGKYFNAANYSNFNFGYFGSKIIDLFVYPWTIDDASYPFSLELFSIIILAMPFLMGCKLTPDLKRYMPLLAFLMAWFLFPTQAAKTSFVYERFSIFLFPFYVLIFEIKTITPPIVEARVKVVCMCIWVAACGWMLKPPVEDIFLLNDEANEFRTLLNDLPEGKAGLSLVYDRENKNGRENVVYVYFPMWYQALKQGWVEYNFAWFMPQVVRYKVDAIPENRPGFAWNPEQFKDFTNCNAYDFLFIRVKDEEQLDKHQALMRESTCSHQLSYQSGSWSVYSLNK